MALSRVAKVTMVVDGNTVNETVIDRLSGPLVTSGVPNVIKAALELELMVTTPALETEAPAPTVETTHVEFGTLSVKPGPPKLCDASAAHVAGIEGSGVPGGRGGLGGGGGKGAGKTGQNDGLPFERPSIASLGMTAAYTWKSVSVADTGVWAGT